MSLMKASGATAATHSRALSPQALLGSVELGGV